MANNNDDVQAYKFPAAHAYEEQQIVDHVISDRSIFAHAQSLARMNTCKSPTLFETRNKQHKRSESFTAEASAAAEKMSASKYKTVIQISSRVENPRERAGSDPAATRTAAARLAKNSSPSGSKHVSP